MKQAKEPVPEFDAEELLKFPANDQGNAECVKAFFGRKLLYTSAYGWMWHTGTHWSREGAEAKVNGAIVAIFKARGSAAFQLADEDNRYFDRIKASRLSAHNRNNCRAMFKDLVTLIKENGRTGADIFDSDPHLLNVKNGVVDLRTGDIRPHDPRDRFTYCLPYDYDPEADVSLWQSFLKRSLGDPDIIPYLQRAVGYTLTGSTREEILFYIYGPARSGKGTFTETLVELLGNPLGKGIAFDMLTRNRSGDTNSADMATLKPCRYVTASESTRYTALNPAVIKSLTGGDRIYCAFKYQDHFDYRPMYKIWLTSNWPVNTDVEDDAAWGRVKVISFPHSHLGQEDKTLKERLQSPESLRGVLAWAIQGAVAWFQSPNGLETPESVQNETQRQRAELDTIATFLEACTETAVDEFTPTGAMYQAYKSWCEDEGVSPKYHNAFTQALKKKGLQYDTRWHKAKTRRGWGGVKISDAVVHGITL